MIGWKLEGCCNRLPRLTWVLFTSRTPRADQQFRQTLPRSWIGVLVWFIIFAEPIFAQHFVPARAGLIVRSQGRVLLNEHPVTETFENLMPSRELRQGGRLRTEAGHAVVFLAPEALLFIGEHTHVELLSSEFTVVRLRLIYGYAVAEVYVLDRVASITLLALEIPVKLKTPGVYRFLLPEGKHRLLQVFAGQAVVTTGCGSLRVKRKHELNLESDFTMRKFEIRGSDTLQRWQRRRTLASRSSGEMDPPRAAPWWTTPGISIFP